MESFTTSPDYHRLLQAIETIQNVSDFSCPFDQAMGIMLLWPRADADCFNLLVFIPGRLRSFRRRAVKRAGRAGSESRTPNRFDSSNTDSSRLPPVCNRG